MTHSADFSKLDSPTDLLAGLTHQQQERLGEVLDRYLASLDDAVPLDPERLRAENPDLAGPLGHYFDSLKALHGFAAGFVGSHSPASAEAPEEVDEKRLGDFILQREIGHGGMGVVYEARQISLDRRVAVKVLPFAAILDSKQVARFKTEALAAAQLHHPNIVPVFAIGSERGVHYYAMQLIDGQPLDQAITDLQKGGGSIVRSATGRDTIDMRRETTRTDGVKPSASRHSFTADRSHRRTDYFTTVAGLGVQAAEALHAAHEYGVVHRDIKPANLLLDGDGKLWVTDFGLARVQTDVSLTRSGDMVGTMRYMSPEQASGQATLVDGRTDVYSLGATLYELLTLRPAFVGESHAELLRQIERDDPIRPRRLVLDIPVDLENIVLKAMAKNREERYATARELADDLRRFLDGRPTVARPLGLVGWLGKWARRNRTLVRTAVALGAVALVALSIATLMIAHEKNRAEANFTLARQHSRDAREAVDHFGARLAEQLAEIPGADQVRQDFLNDTLNYYRKFVEQADGEPSLRTDLAMTYSKIGLLHERIGAAEDAMAAHRHALDLFAELAAEEPGNNEHKQHLALAYNDLGLLQAKLGQTDAAMQSLRQAQAIQEELVRSDGDNPAYPSELAATYSNLALACGESGRPDEAEQFHQESLRLQQRIAQTHPENPEYLRNLARGYNNLSTVYTGNDPEKAIDCFEQALAVYRRLPEPAAGSLECRAETALIYSNLGALQAQTGRFDQAEQSFTRAIDIQRELVAASPASKTYRHDLAVSYNNLGRMQNRLDRNAEAIESFHQALLLQEALVRQYPGDIRYQSSLGGMYNNLGIVLEELGREDQAVEAYASAVRFQRTAFDAAPQVAQFRDFLSKHYFNYGRVLRRLGRPAEAAQAAIQRKQLWPTDPQRLLSVAEELALCVKQLRQLDSVGDEVNRCEQTALTALRQAVDCGLKPPLQPESRHTLSVLDGGKEFDKWLKP